MKYGRRIVLLIATTVAGAVGWYFGSPHWTLYQMRTAADAGDAEKLLTYIDSQALRENTRAQILEGLTFMREIPDRQNRERYERVIRTMASDAAIDPMVSRKTMLGMFAGGQRPGGGSGRGRDEQIVREGMNRFRVHDVSLPADEGDLIFRRHGLNWKLDGIRWRSQ
jgi:hypothetical protein